MSRKKKSGRRQLAQERRAALARIRAERGWARHKPAARQVNSSELAEDMLHLFPELTRDGQPSAGATQRLLELLMDSDKLAREPEFEAIFLDPMQCLNALEGGLKKRGLDQEQLEQLPEEESEEIYADVRVDVAAELLTDQLRQDILDALDSLRLRLKGAGDRNQAARVATMQSFLGSDVTSEIWPVIGLVQAILERSLAAAFALLDASERALQSIGEDRHASWETILPKLTQYVDGLGDTAGQLLPDIPGLSAYLQKSTDATWEQGDQAVFRGELYLELYTLSELETAARELVSVITGLTPQELAAGTRPSGPIDNPDPEVPVARMDEYVTQLMTPERFEQLCQHLTALLADVQLADKWRGYLMLLTQQMAEPGARQTEHSFLVHALFGELHHESKREGRQQGSPQARHARRQRHASADA